MATHLTMPRLSQDMERGTIVEWLKQEGESVEQGDVVVVVETDKANVDVEAPAAGTLLRIVTPDGVEAPIGALLAIIGMPGEVDDATSATELPESAPVTPTPSAAAAPAPTTPVPAAGRQPVSPAARRVARELGVELDRVAGTGTGGLVTEADVRSFADAGGGVEPVVSGEADDVVVIPLEGKRRRIADRMSLSRRTVADVTTVIDVEMDAVARVRAASGLSYTTYVAWAVSRSLLEFPDLNATLVEDEIRRYRKVDLGMAVAIDDGLVVPVVRDAAALAPAALEAEIGRLAGLARDGRIQPADLAGATFSVTNSGTFGSLLFTPIINVPQVAILGVGRVADVPVVRDGAVVPGKVMYLSLSYDHRAVDGATAVKFLATVKRRLQDVETETAS